MKTHSSSVRPMLSRRRSDVLMHTQTGSTPVPKRVTIHGHYFGSGIGGCSVLLIIEAQRSQSRKHSSRLLAGGVISYTLPSWQVFIGFGDPDTRLDTPFFLPPSSIRPLAIAPGVRHDTFRRPKLQCPKCFPIHEPTTLPRDAYVVYRSEHVEASRSPLSARR